MNGAILIAAVLLFMIAAGIAEYALHRRNLKKIPLRIHVNGTRGKSSVTRLIAAGLNRGGIAAVAKTTGTLPRIILPDGTEFPVYRPSRANIIEQLRIISFAARNQARALVIDCLALQPYLQALCETRLVRSTHGVITNAREDHLDVMGPTERDVALALLGTTPPGGVLYSCEKDYPVEFARACREKKTRLVTIADEEIDALGSADIDGFPYVEHPENVALALRVCRDLGVDRDTALTGMHAVRPDPGAMKDITVRFFGKTIHFVNGFAANDPESTEQIWRMALEKHHAAPRRIMVINCRLDRPDRSRQFGEALHQWPAPDRYILIGSGSYFLIKAAASRGVHPALFVNAEGLGAERIFEEIVNHCGPRSIIMGAGNTAGPGLEIIKYFYNRATPLEEEAL